MASTPGATLDTLTSRNNTAISIKFNGSVVGRVQQFRASQANNVQIFAELGRDYMVEMAKGLSVFNFAISSFYVRSDVMDTLRGGAIFGLVIIDSTSGTAETIDSFDKCMINSIDRTYSAGAATVGQDAAVLALGKGNLGT